VSRAAAHTCDLARWNALAKVTQHAWLLSTDSPHAHPIASSGGAGEYGHIPVTVLDTEGDDIEVASITASLIVTRWVPTTALGRAAMSNTVVSPSPGAAPDPAVRIRIGYQLPSTGEGWLPVRQVPMASEGLEVEGFVSSDLRGVVWDEPPRVEHGRHPIIAGWIRSAPRDDAPIRAKLTDSAEIVLRGETPGWFEITARTPHAEVDGFVAKPPPPPPPRPRPAGTYDFSEDTIEGELPEPNMPLAIGSCLYDAPAGHVVGMIIGAQSVEKDIKRASTSGWFTVELPTVWGAVTYYTRAWHYSFPSGDW
jgi:hypothetical protein